MSPLLRIAKLFRALAPAAHLEGGIADPEVRDRNNALNECIIFSRFLKNGIDVCARL